MKNTDITSNNDKYINVKKLYINPELNKDVLYSISFVFTYINSTVFSFKMWEMEAFNVNNSNLWYKLYDGENVNIELTPKQNVELTVKSHNGIVTFTSRFKMDKITTSFKIPFDHFKPFIKNYIDCHKMINEYWEKINEE